MKEIVFWLRKVWFPLQFVVQLPLGLAFALFLLASGAVVFLEQAIPTVLHPPDWQEKLALFMFDKLQKNAPMEVLYHKDTMSLLDGDMQAMVSYAKTTSDQHSLSKPESEMTRQHILNSRGAHFVYLYQEQGVVVLFYG